MKSPGSASASPEASSTAPYPSWIRKIGAKTITGRSAPHSSSGTVPSSTTPSAQETIEEILDISIEVMTEHGVNGLTLAEVARRLGVQTPSIYK